MAEREHDLAVQAIAALDVVIQRRVRPTMRSGLRWRQHEGTRRLYLNPIKPVVIVA